MRDRYMLDERQARGAELLADVIIGVEDLVENPEALLTRGEQVKSIHRALRDKWLAIPVVASVTDPEAHGRIYSPDWLDGDGLMAPLTGTRGLVERIEVDDGGLVALTDGSRLHLNRLKTGGSNGLVEDYRHGLQVVTFQPVTRG
jgi:hypothetical protein